MWRRASQNPTVLAPPYQDAGAELHAHSPRRRMEKQPYFRGYETPLARKAGSDEQRFASPATVQGLQQASSRFGFAPGQFTNECATPSPGYDWPSAPSLLWGPKNLRKLRKSSTDTSMPDYVPSPGAGRCETVSRFEVQPGNLGSTGNNTGIIRPSFSGLSGEPLDLKMAYSAIYEANILHRPLLFTHWEHTMRTKHAGIIGGRFTPTAASISSSSVYWKASIA